MSEYAPVPDCEPKDLEELFDLLPARCRGCDFARTMIMLFLTFESSVGESPIRTINQIRTKCLGPTMPHSDPPTGQPLTVVQDPFKPGYAIAELPQEGAPGNAYLLPATDDARLGIVDCPFRELISQDDDEP